MLIQPFIHYLARSLASRVFVVCCEQLLITCSMLKHLNCALEIFEIIVFIFLFSFDSKSPYTTMNESAECVLAFKLCQWSEQSETKLMIALSTTITFAANNEIL